MKTKTINHILVERGSGLGAREEQSAVRDKKASGAIVSEFLSHNEKGDIRVFVAGGSRAGNQSVYVKQAYQLGLEIGRKQYRLDFGLSSKGIMGAVAKGVLNAWVELGRSQKIPIKGVTTQEYLALYQSDEILDQVSDIIVAHTLEERKKQLLAANFVIFAPGGVGTLDELVYDCVAMQDGFLPFKPFVLFNVNGFFYHLLEYLKAIHLKGFADPVPFIVVDDSFEAGVAFDMIGQYYEHCPSGKDALKSVQKLIYHLPYVIEQKKADEQKSVTQILREITSVLEGTNLALQKKLTADIEAAYLDKEIERMYERLSTAGQDTAVISRKLARLKRRYKNGEGK